MMNDVRRLKDFLLELITVHKWTLIGNKDVVLEERWIADVTRHIYFWSLSIHFQFVRVTFGSKLKMASSLFKHGNAELTGA